MFSPDGRTLASVSRDRTVQLWDTETWEPRRTLMGPEGQVYSVVFSPDGRTLAGRTSDDTLRLWDPETGEEKGTLTEHTHALRGVAF